MFMLTYMYVQNSNNAKKNRNSPNNMYGGGPVLGTFGNEEEDVVNSMYHMATNGDTIDSMYDTPTNDGTVDDIYDMPTDGDTIENIYDTVTNEDAVENKYDMFTDGNTIENICYELVPIKKSTKGFDSSITIEKDNGLHEDTVKSVYDMPTNGNTIENIHVYETLTNEDTTLGNGNTIENICYELGPIKKSTNSFDTSIAIENDNTLDFEEMKEMEI